MKKTESILFRSFMNGSYKESVRKPRPYKAYSIIMINPMALLDPTILTIGGIVLGVVLLERFLERFGALDIAERISGVIRFLLPATFFGALIYFLMTFSI